MRVKVTKHQLELLINNFHLIGDKGLGMQMSGKTARLLMPKDEVLKEQKLFKVNLWLDAFNTSAVVLAGNSSSAREVASRLFPNARVYSAKEIKRGVC